jgi:Ca-activated chloride channel family protein
MRFSRLYLIAFMLLPQAVFASSVETAPDNPKIMIVLDASGSMWGQIDGKAKIEIAREVITDLLDQWDPSIHLGLTVYGHRRKGDCKDIETVIPVGQGTAGKISRTINGIQPKGKTPLSDAVRHAARALRYEEECATVVLISDGVETCNADPCAVGAELSMGGFDFTAHVIGFDLKDEEQVGLRCLAENTGGQFLAAADAAGLRSALSQAMEIIAEPPPPVVEEPGESSISAPAEVPAGSEFEVEWQGPDSRKDYIPIVHKGADENAYLNFAYTKQGNPARITAPDEPGPYEVRYFFGHQKKVLASVDITVTPVTAKVTPPAQVTAGAYFETPWTGPDNRGDYISIVLPEAAKGEYLSYAYTANGSPAKIQAPADQDTYEVRYIMGRSKTVLARAGITVTSVSGSVAVPESVAAGSKFQVNWSGPDNKSDYISIVKPGGAESSYLSYTYTSNGNPVELQAPAEPGEYEVRYILSQNKSALARINITVTPVSGSVEAPASVPAGSHFQVNWSGPDNQSDYIAIVKPDAAESSYLSYTYTSNGNPVKIQAPAEPGEYEVRYILSQNKSALARTRVIVE